MLAFDLILFTSELVHFNFNLFEISHDLLLFFFALTLELLLLLKSVTKVFNAHLDRVLVFLLEEGLCCHIANRTLDFVTSFECLLEISLHVGYCLSLQLESEILLLQFFILLVGRSKLILHLLDILFGRLKCLLVAIEVTL